MRDIDNYITILKDMSQDLPLAFQLSSSWHLASQSYNTADQYFQKMKAQGQSFFRASGDSGAYSGSVPFPTEDTNITIVGGTTLTTSGPGGGWVSENVWNNGDGQRSGGGISTQFGLPSWQIGVFNSANGGSTTHRNIPDVALTADNISIEALHQWYTAEGTSAAAPLWAGYTALINQRAAENSLPPIGFLNPLLYAIGKASSYSSDFHDITSGNNNGFNAVSGYDLCTGWGTPNGLNLMGDLAPNKIHIDQKLSTGTQVGTIGKWNGSSFSPRLNPGDSISISPGSTTILQGDQNVYSGEKYNIWKRNLDFESNVINHHSFVIQPDDHNFTSIFKPRQNATIQSQLLETGSIGGFLKFQDPWLIDFQEVGFGNNLRNQGMIAPFNNVNYSSTNPNLGTNTSHLGVFLNQTTNLSGYYSIQAPLTQPINGYNCAFQNWNSPDATFQQVGSNPIGYDQKAIIFNNSGATVTANYKGINISNSTSAYSNSSQRKMVRTPDGILHKVYESMGHVWYETSLNNGASWSINNNGHPLDNGAGKLPSIDWQPNNVAIVFQQQNGNNYTIQAQVFYAYSGNYVVGTSATLYTELYDAYSVNANPNISWGYNSKFMVPFERKQNGFPSTYGINYVFGSMAYNNITIISTGRFAGTDNNSINTTVSTNKAYNDTARFQFAWEQYNNQTSRYINYSKTTIGSTWVVNSTAAQNISSGNGYLWNYSPSIIATTDGGARVSWIGDYSGNGSMVNIVYHDPSYYRFWNFGYNVRSNSISLSDDNLTGFFAWSQYYGGNTYSNNFTSIITLGQPKTLNTTGKDIQLSNGAGSVNMYVTSFFPFSTPYYFQTSNNMASFPKINPNSVNCGRGSVIAKNGAQFNYMLGDITVDGKDINFVNTVINSDYNSFEKINGILISDAFILKNNSDFNISELYGVLDSAAALSVLGKDHFINYKIELIDVSNGKVIGIIDNISITSVNLNSRKMSLYQVNTTGLGGKTVKIRITESSNIDAPMIALIEKYADESVLGKISPQKINIQGTVMVKDYALEQNYPNPFNPSTTIKYQLPEAGMVTVKIFDMLGKEVANLVNEYKTEGKYNINFDASKLASGVYIYQMKSNNYISSKKMMLLK